MKTDIKRKRLTIPPQLYRALCTLLAVTAIAGISPYHDARAASAQNVMPPAVRGVLARTNPLIHQEAYDRAIMILKAFQARGASMPEPETRSPKGYHHPEIYFTLGTCYLLKNNYLSAAQAYQQAVQRNPAHVAAWLNLAKAAYELKDYSQAARSFAEAYENSRDKNPDHLYFSAVAYLMDGRCDASINAFEQLIKNHPQKMAPSWRENFIHALLTADEASRALPHIKLLAEHYTGEKQIRWQEILLHQYVQCDMRDQARNYALFLTQQAPTRAKWWKALSHIYLQESQYKSALTALTIYSHLQTPSDQETQLLADLHLQLGIPLKAVPLYKAVLQHRIKPPLLRNLMLALQALGRPEQALAALEQLAPRTQAPELLMLKADLLYNLERYSAAALIYRQTAKRDTPQKGRAWLMAGYAALQANDVDAGRRALEQAATFNHHRKAALVAIKQLAKTQPRAWKKGSSL